MKKVKVERKKEKACPEQRRRVNRGLGLAKFVKLREEDPQKPCFFKKTGFSFCRASFCTGMPATVAKKLILFFIRIFFN